MPLYNMTNDNMMVANVTCNYHNAGIFHSLEEDLALFPGIMRSCTY